MGRRLQVGRQVKATLRLYHRLSTPEIATELLGIEPTRTQSAGFDPEAGARRPNGWFLSSGEHRDLGSALHSVLAQLDRERLDALREQQWSVDVLCSVESKGGSSFFTIPPEDSYLAGSLGLPLVVLMLSDVDDAPGTTRTA